LCVVSRVRRIRLVKRGERHSGVSCRSSERSQTPVRADLAAPPIATALGTVSVAGTGQTPSATFLEVTQLSRAIPER